MGIQVCLEDMLPLIENVIQREGQVRFKPAGRSMEPLIRNRKDIVTIEEKAEIKKYDIIFYKRPNGKYIIHRIVKVDKKGNYYVCGDNQKTVEFPVCPNQVIGTVTGIERGNQFIRTDRAGLYSVYCYYCELRASFFSLAGKGKNFLKRIWRGNGASKRD